MGASPSPGAVIVQRNKGHLRGYLSCRTAFSLMESTVSVLLVGILMIAALQALGASKRRESSSVDSVLAQQLADTLMTEILLQA